MIRNLINTLTEYNDLLKENTKYGRIVLFAWMQSDNIHVYTYAMDTTMVVQILRSGIIPEEYNNIVYYWLRVMTTPSYVVRNCLIYITQVTTRLARQAPHPAKAIRLYSFYKILYNPFTAKSGIRLKAMAEFPTRPASISR